MESLHQRSILPERRRYRRKRTWCFSSAIHHVMNTAPFCLVLATLATLIGLGITFVGLAYHHYRRHHELLKNHPELTGYHHGTGTTSTHSMPPPPP